MAKEDWHHLQCIVIWLTKKALAWQSLITIVKTECTCTMAQGIDPKAATHVTFTTQEQVCLSWRVSQESLRTVNNLLSMSVYHSVLFNNGHQFGWWVSRDSLKMKYWGGASLSNKCACGMTNSCVNPGNGCNCDANDNLWQAPHWQDTAFQLNILGLEISAVALSKLIIHSVNWSAMVSSGETSFFFSLGLRSKSLKNIWSVEMKLNKMTSYSAAFIMILARLNWKNQSKPYQLEQQMVR